ncbi:MAG TPA: response regulator transcription factor [Magnetospirillum sp.]|jgi:DNA-binding NarL/FixJ family response regulator|nr:response regulator transcription factor [Magnetospirillum sp.]
MTIIVAGDNQLAKENLASALGASLDRSVVCVDDISEIYDVSIAAVVLLDYAAVAAHSLDVIRASLPDTTKVAVYSAPGTADEAMGWLCRGYDGYLPRSMTAPAIVCAVQLMLRGERFVPSIAISAPAPSGGQVNSDSRQPDCGLSPRQREVLSMVATGASNKHIARALHVEEVTIKSHVKAIFRKLGVRSRTEAARYVLSPGRAEMPRVLMDVPNYSSVWHAC